ncbi:hypothetical protein [Actinomadura pelletieri]|uniref:hypothetical protein n=1 Tax=Actinomadura pelletieri TaxID=111805 RepID=UPI0011C4932A|nr:hypothetical protein [Actinomadura pelletieri]
MRLEFNAVVDTADGLFIKLGDDRAPVPGPFAALVRKHLANKPNLRTGSAGRNVWPFAGTRAGAALPAPIAATMLGYSPQVI